METIRNKRWILPAFGIVAATATNAILPGNGAFLLLPVLLICWYLQRFSRKEMGFVVGRADYYGLGLLHPVLVLSLLALVAWAAGAVNVENANWSGIALIFAIQALATMLVTLVTEDGFFRGWLWAISLLMLLTGAARLVLLLRVLRRSDDERGMAAAAVATSQRPA